jgi:uncharacterized protein YycO
VTITVRFLRDHSIGSRFIQWQTWGKWSHIDVATPGGWIGALFRGGVQVRPLNTVGVDQLMCTVEVTDAQGAAIIAFLVAQIGKPYDWRSLLGFLVRRDWREPDSWFCSELVVAAFEAGGVKLLRTDDVERISPSTLALSPLWVC